MREKTYAEDYVIKRNPLAAREDAAFEFAGVLDGILGPRLGFEARLGDGFAGAFAHAIGAVADLGERDVNFAQELAVFFDQAEGEFLLVIVGAHVGHVNREIRQVAARGASQGFLLHGVNIAQKLAALGDEQVAEGFEFPGLEAGLIFDGLAGDRDFGDDHGGGHRAIVAGLSAFAIGAARFAAGGNDSGPCRYVGSGLGPV